MTDGNLMDTATKPHQLYMAHYDEDGTWHWWTNWNDEWCRITGRVVLEGDEPLLEVEHKRKVYYGFFGMKTRIQTYTALYPREHIRYLATSPAASPPADP